MTTNNKECLEPYELMKYSFVKRVKYKIIKELLQGHRLGQVLDIGSGAGFFSERLAKRSEKMISIDISSENIEEASKHIRSHKISYVLADATRLPFAEKSFDTIIAADVIEHIERDDLMIAEVDRVLSDKGKCIITTVCTNPSINLNFLRKWIGYDMASAWGHVRAGYNIKDFRRLIKDKNLKIKKVRYSLPLIGELISNLTIYLRKRKAPQTWESGRDLSSVGRGKTFQLYKKIFPLVYGIVLLDNLLFFLRGNKIEILLTRKFLPHQVNQKPHRKQWDM